METLETWKLKAGYLRKADKALVGLALPPVWAMAIECYDALQAAVAKINDLQEEVEQSDKALDERTAQYHLAHAKILSREAIIEQLSDTELAKDVTWLEAEVGRLREVEKWLGCMHTPAQGEWSGEEIGYWTRGAHIFGTPQVENMCREIIAILKPSGPKAAEVNRLEQEIEDLKKELPYALRGIVERDDD